VASTGYREELGYSFNNSNYDALNSIHEKMIISVMAKIKGQIYT
jgi:hypothetical protein